MFGVGLNRPVQGVYAKTIEHMNASSGVKVAVDIPSGISSDSGCVLGTAFRADLTVTFQTKRQDTSSIREEAMPEKWLWQI